MLPANRTFTASLAGSALRGCLVIGVLIGVAAPQLCRADDLAAEVYEMIRRSEDHLRDVEVRARMTRESREGGVWRQTHNSRATAQFVAVTGSKMRLELEQTAPWPDGPGGVGFGSWVTTYNGQLGQELLRATGTPQAPFEVLRGTVRADRPLMLEGARWVTGWAFSLPGCLSEAGSTLRLSEVLRRHLEEEPRLEVRRVEWNDQACVMLLSRAPEPHTRIDIFYIDPARGGAFLGRQVFERPGVLLKEVIVDELSEPVQGLFYPVAARRLGYTDGEVSSRTTYRADEVRLNVGFDDSLFTLQWPPGSYVENAITGEFIRVARDATVDSERGSMGEAPSGGRPAAERAAVVSRSDGVVAATNATPWSWAWLLAIALAGVSIAVMVVWRWRSHGEGTSHPESAR